MKKLVAIVGLLLSSGAIGDERRDEFLAMKLEDQAMCAAYAKHIGSEKHNEYWLAVMVTSVKNKGTAEDDISGKVINMFAAKYGLIEGLNKGRGLNSEEAQADMITTYRKTCQYNLVRN
ncbi:hypothetical protein EKG38_14025 [Shewanella canadensis]|uniref:Uncharacterized protein n=1 Tax=Shewanella canadensis TaxID=271096 RepID=A0A3S0L0Q9_9GAMM|nr:hypothetical protein [Shewanella canadensis]RTR38617.1 hypothetical protein EKG38_14025 [Shewanella canadensis]